MKVLEVLIDGLGVLVCGLFDDLVMILGEGWFVLIVGDEYNFCFFLICSNV